MLTQSDSGRYPTFGCWVANSGPRVLISKQIDRYIVCGSGTLWHKGKKLQKNLDKAYFDTPVILVCY